MGASPSFRRKYYPDTVAHRLAYFEKCLKKLEEAVVVLQKERTEITGAKEMELQTKIVIVFPERIGCGLAGGNWTEYKLRIEQFANRLPRPEFEVRIYSM